MQILAALLTPTIALLALMIAFLQWRTAHQRVLLDLFEKRLAIYRQLNQTLSDATGFPHIFVRPAEVQSALDAARFLFGSDVQLYLSDTLNRFNELVQLNIYNASDMRPKDLDRRNALINELRESRDDVLTLFEPYMRLDQKRIRSPAEWFRERNEIRKSYGDK